MNTKRLCNTQDKFTNNIHLYAMYLYSVYASLLYSKLKENTINGKKAAKKKKKTKLIK